MFGSKEKIMGREFLVIRILCVATVSGYGNEEVIANHVKYQGNEYKKLFRDRGIEGQLSMFDYM